MPNQRIIVQSTKSEGLAAILGFFLGPLGLFYSTITGAIVMFFINIVVAVFTLGLGLFLTWPICALWGYFAAKSYNDNLMASAMIDDQQYQTPTRSRTETQRNSVHQKSDPPVNEKSYDVLDQEEKWREYQELKRRASQAKEQQTAAKRTEVSKKLQPIDIDKVDELDEDETEEYSQPDKNRIWFVAFIIVSLLFLSVIAFSFINNNIRQNIFSEIGLESRITNNASLGAFQVMVEGIQKSNEAIDRKNFSLMDAFQAQHTNDPINTRRYYTDAHKAVMLSDEFVSKIEILRNLIVEQGSEAVLIKSGNGNKLIGSIDELRSTFLSLSSLTEQDKKVLSTEMPLSREYINEFAEKKTWDYLFVGLPDKTVDAILVKLEGDAKNSVGLILETLFKKIGTTNYKFDALAAKVIAPSSYVLTGQEYKADIFVSATSSTQDPKVYIGTFNENVVENNYQGWLPSKVERFPLNPGYDSIPTVNGFGKYTDKSTTIGVKERTGAVKVRKPQGTGYDYFPFRLEYQIAEAGLVISPSKMNVLYIGVDNPISISVPGFSADNITPVFNKNGTLTQIKPGIYTANVTTVDLRGETELQVYVESQDGSKKMMGSKAFRIKRVPDPTPMVGPDKGGSVKATIFKDQRGMQAVLENFDFDVRFSIISFEMTFAAARQDLLSTSTEGPLFSQKMLDYLSKGKPGDVFFFDKIKAKGPDGTNRNLPSIVFKLI